MAGIIIVPAFLIVIECFVLGFYHNKVEFSVFYYWVIADMVLNFLGPVGYIL